MSSLIDNLRHLPLLSLIHQREGALTRELMQQPGGFGLGQLPARSLPDAVTKMVCGYCSTGCSLNVHLQNGQATNLSPSTEYPVNLGMACPKGWEALTVLDAPDRATTPLLRNANGKLVPVEWNTAITEFVSRMKGIQERHGSAFHRLSQHGTDSDRRDGVPGCAGEIWHGNAARGRQHSPMHGDGCRCLQTGIRFRCTSLHLRRL